MVKVIRPTGGQVRSFGSRHTALYEITEEGRVIDSIWMPVQRGREGWELDLAMFPAKARRLLGEHWMTQDEAVTVEHEKQDRSVLMSGAGQTEASEMLGHHRL